MVVNIWSSNLNKEMNLMHKKLNTHPIISVDTEFPGFLSNRPMSAPEDLRYEDLVYNVNNLKLIQLGFTLFNGDGDIGGTWQINFSGFYLNQDSHVVESIELLKKNGIDFERNRIDGVDSEIFAEKFNEILSQHRNRISWVTFHGIYDLAYLSKILSKKDIPDYRFEFVEMVVSAMSGVFYDIKAMVNQGQFVGLEKLANRLSVQRVGEAHQAGSDSLLTAKVFLKLFGGMDKFVLKKFQGCLFGISIKIPSSINYRTGVIPYVPPPIYYARPVCYPIRLLQPCYAVYPIRIFPMHNSYLPSLI